MCLFFWVTSPHLTLQRMAVPLTTSYSSLLNDAERDEDGSIILDDCGNVVGDDRALPVSGRKRKMSHRQSRRTMLLVLVSGFIL